MAPVGTSRALVVLTIAVCACAALFVPDGRHFLLYNAIPLLCLAGLVAVFDSRVPQRWFVAGAFAIISGLHLWAAFALPVRLEPDSAGYIAWARDFAHGRGFPGMIYRAPGYPFLLGLTFLGGSTSLLPIVVVQHGALIVTSLLVYLLSLECGLDRRVGVLGMVLFGCNSLVMQIGQWIMTEAVFALLVTAMALASVRVLRRPSVVASILAGVCFAAADLVRPMLTPLLVLIVIGVLVRHRRAAVRAALAMAAVYAAMVLPWSARNAVVCGAFGPGGGQGVQLFTKATSYGLLSQGPAVRALQPVLDNVARDLSVDLSAPPRFPEDDWTLNRVPHALADSLTTRHGRSFAEADRMLRRAAVESFAAHPGRYAAAVGRGLAAMLFTHREMFPRIDAVMPVGDERLPVWLARVVRGLLYSPGILVLLFPALLLARRNLPRLAATPFLVFGYGYLVTAAVQVGFTRYTIPWAGCAAVCVAAVLMAWTGPAGGHRDYPA